MMSRWPLFAEANCSAEQTRWGAALWVLTPPATTPFQSTSNGTACSFSGIPICHNSLGISQVLLCLRKGTSQSTYNSQNLLHLRNYAHRNHQYEPAGCYSFSALGLMLCHHQSHAEPTRLQGLFRPSRTGSIKFRYPAGWSVLASRLTGSQSNSWYLNGSLDLFRQNSLLKCVLCEYLGQNLTVGLIPQYNDLIIGLPAFVVVQIYPYFTVWVGLKHILTLVISSEKC